MKRVNEGISNCGAKIATTTPRAATVPILRNELK